MPLVLSAAGHGKGDIPAALAREQVRHPGLRYRYGRPLGPHPVLLDVLEARIDAALAGRPGVSRPADERARGRAARAGTHVVLVGRGSTDPDGNAEVAKVARLLWEGRGYDDVALSFVSLAGPSVPAALERARRLGAERIVVAPYFLFAGVLPDRVTAQAGAFAEQHPGIDVRVAGLIGACDELAGLVLERYAEALHGDIRMNCDTCAYRIAMPGFTGKVGQPQTPHHHPDDLAALGTVTTVFTARAAPLGQALVTRERPVPPVGGLPGGRGSSGGPGQPGPRVRAPTTAGCCRRYRSTGRAGCPASW